MSKLAGVVECTQQIPKGTTMKWEFGGSLQDAYFTGRDHRFTKSEFGLKYDRMAGQNDRQSLYLIRYVKVSGLEEVDDSCFTGKAIYSEMDRTGEIETGNVKINRLHENVVWGLKSNFIDMPTDCPQRDERLT